MSVHLYPGGSVTDQIYFSPTDSSKEHSPCPMPYAMPHPPLSGQMEGSSFLIIKISASLKISSLLLALQIIAFMREKQ